MNAWRGLTIHYDRSIETQSKLSWPDSQSLLEFPLLNKRLHYGARFSRSSIMLLEFKLSPFVFELDAKMSDARTRQSVASLYVTGLS